MDHTIVLAFTVLSAVIAAIDFTYGYKAFRKTEAFGRNLGLAAFAVNCVRDLF